MRYDAVMDLAQQTRRRLADLLSAKTEQERQLVTMLTETLDLQQTLTLCELVEYRLERPTNRRMTQGIMPGRNVQRADCFPNALKEERCRAGVGACTLTPVAGSASGEGLHEPFLIKQRVLSNVCRLISICEIPIWVNMSVSWPHMATLGHERRRSKRS
jgi:hypothetical protein